MVDKTASKITGSMALGVFALYFTMFGAPATTPAIAALGAAFPDADLTVISLISNLPSFTTIFGCLIVGALAGKKIKFKTIAVIAMLLYGVFGVLSTFINSSVEIILVWRAISGFGIGLVMPLGAAVFMRIIRDKELRSTYLGRGAAVATCGSVILTMLGGWLAGISWQYTFLAYLLVFVSLIVLLIFFKEPPTIDEILSKEGVESAEDFKAAKRVSIPAISWVFLLLFMCYQMFQSPTLFSLSNLLADANGGADMSAVAGILLSVFVLAQIPTAFFADKLIKVLGKFTGAIFFIVGAIGIIIVATADSTIMIGVGIAVLGLAGAIVVVTNFELSLLTTPAGMAWIASLVMIATNLGNVLSSYWIGIVFSIVGDTSNFQALLYVGAAGFIVCSVIWIITNLNNKRRAISLAEDDKNSNSHQNSH